MATVSGKPDPCNRILMYFDSGGGHINLHR